MSIGYSDFWRKHRNEGLRCVRCLCSVHSSRLVLSCESVHDAWAKPRHVEAELGCLISSPFEGLGS